MGGAQDQQIISQSEEKLVELVHNDLKNTLLRDDAPAPVVISVKAWKKGIPQFKMLDERLSISC